MVIKCFKKILVYSCCNRYKAFNNKQTDGVNVTITHQKAVEMFRTRKQKKTIELYIQSGIILLWTYYLLVHHQLGIWVRYPKEIKTYPLRLLLYYQPKYQVDV